MQGAIEELFQEFLESVEGDKETARQNLEKFIDFVEASRQTDLISASA